MRGLFDWDKWQEIFATIAKNKLRSFLTALGVFWGIFMLVFLLGMGKGLENGVKRNFGGIAKNIMFVWSWRTTLPYNGYAAGRAVPLELSDLDILRSQVDELDKIAPRNTVGPFIVDYKGINKSYEIRGELTEMPNIMAMIVHKGRYINQSDIDAGRKVAVLGVSVRDLLFGDKDPIGQHILIKGIDFRVVGVFGPEKEGGNNRDDMEAVVIPLTTMDRAFGTGGFIDYMVVSAKSGVHVADMEPKIRRILKELNNVDPNDPQGIGGFNLEKEYQQIQSLFLGIQVLFWTIGIGTLLAGIVGVSNIMLIIVKERTKEIGIRKALGAEPRSIISMILTESIFITSMSGYLGIVCGTFLIWGFDSLMEMNDMEVDNFYNPEVNLGVAVVAMLTLIVAGTIAGLIPALQAAKVNPVTALKDE